MHLALRVMCNVSACTALAAGTIAASAAPAAAAAPTSIGPTTAATSFTTWPWSRPRCPERAPAGAVFIKRVQPPLGLGYDLYAYRGTLLRIFC